MLVPIGDITKELNIPAFQLHKWEERGWLGTEPVLKDPNNNGQRVYNEEQIERIRFIHEEIEEQRKEGIKRTKLEKVQEKLLDKFGGEIVQKETSLALPDDTLNTIVDLFRLQNKKIEELESIVRQQAQKELPAPVDHTPQIEELKKTIEELVTSRRDEWITKRRVEQRLRKEAIELWNQKPEEERMIGKWLWKQEDKIKRDDFIQAYIDEKIIDEYKND